MKEQNVTKKKILKLLIDKDLTIKKLAKKIGKSRTWTSNVITGRFSPPETRKAIADALGVNVKDLWGDDNGDNGHREAA